MARSTHLQHPWRHRLAVAVATLALVLPGAAAAKHFSAWGPAEAEIGINDPAPPPQADGCPIESPNGLELYIASNRAGNVGGSGDPNDIWKAQRATVDSDWGSPENLGSIVNSAAADFCPTPLNGNRLLFVSTRGGPGACGMGDMYFTRNNPRLGWSAPVNLGCDPVGPNSAGGEFSPSLVETDQGVLLYFSRPSLAGDQDIYVSSQRPDGGFGPATPVSELNTTAADQMPNVSRDGLEIVFSSTRGGGFGGQDVYTANRSSTTDAWSNVANVGSNVNTGGNETRASLSGDGERLHFGRDGTIFVSIREKVTGRD